MDYLAQLLTEIIVTSVAVLLIANLLRRFGVKGCYICTVLFPFIVFPVGFSLRLTGIQEMIDTGFFLTDFSFLFVYLLTGMSLVLGQLKYWKKN